MTIRSILFPTVLLLAGAALAQDPPSRVARLNHLEGAVSFQPASVDQWAEATLNYPLTIGDHLYCDENARAEMHIGSTAIRLAPRTNMSFLNLDDQTVQIQLTGGAIDLRIRHLDDRELYEIDTPNGAISLLRTGEYRIDTDPDRNATTVTVREGEAEATANGASFPIHPRQTASFSGDGSQQDVRAANAPDGFDQFCRQRDQREDSAPPPRYVSREMAGYEDLDANGTWRTVPEYGAVWVPRVEAGWAPYRFGHWAWVEPWGWTWIDNAPWGFAPFHYGRWAFIAGAWGWVPGPPAVRPVYAPALVAFVGGNNWSVSLRIGGGGGVAWFPLGPREAYQPAYHVSPTYVNRVNVTSITNVTNVTTINRVNVTNVKYVNQTVPGAVTAVTREDFVAARPVHRAAIAVAPAAAASAPVVQSAGVAPRRESILARSETRAAPQPRPAMVQRQVVTKTPPPPAPVPFAAKQQALQASPGRPVDPGTLRTLRSNTPPPLASRPAQVAQPIRPAIQPGIPQPAPSVAAPPVTPQSKPPDAELVRQRQLQRQQQQQQPVAQPVPPAVQPPNRPAVVAPPVSPLSKPPDAELVRQRQQQRQQQQQQQPVPSPVPPAVQQPNRPAVVAPPVSPLSKPPDAELVRQRQQQQLQEQRVPRQEVKKENHEARKADAKPQAKEDKKDEKKKDEKRPPDR